ncbi:MAG: PKD domain-containing protein [Sphingobacteriales bacterium]|nr:MAG: PKD domain-containing protein [Sphingobacteriales bacterium]
MYDFTSYFKRCNRILILFCGFTALISASNQLSAQNCTANFMFTMNGLSVEFMDMSVSNDGSPIVSWSWDFDDGATSTQQNPVHNFPEPDKYDVCLLIETANGCQSEFCIKVEICDLTISSTVGTVCNAEGQINVSVTIQDIYDTAKNINVFLDGQLIAGSPFNIDDVAPVILSLTLPGDGLNHTIEAISDDVAGCNQSLSFAVPDCFSDCFISSMNTTITGGTTYVVTVNDNFFSPQTVTVNVGDIVQFNWANSGHTTTSDATSGPLVWNSGQLSAGATYDVLITHPGTHQYYCIPHGGPGGAGMSGMIVANCPAGGVFPVLVSFNTSLVGAGGYNILLDGIPTAGSPYNYTGTGANTAIINVSGDGAEHTIIVQDVADPTCQPERIFAAPDCGAAPPCSVSLSATLQGGCVGLNAPYLITVNAINGSTTGFNLLINNIPTPESPILYNPIGSTTINVLLPGNGLTQTISVQDTGAPGTCSDVLTLTTPNCALPCNIGNLTASTGTAVTHIVQVQDFQFVPANINVTVGDIVQFVWTGAVQHTSTSDATIGDLVWNSGLHGTGFVYDVVITAPGTHGYYCIPHGAPGGIGMSGSITALPPCNEGMVAVQVGFTAVNGSASGYHILLDGVPVNVTPYAYSPGSDNTQTVNITGDGLEHTLSVQDVTTVGCTATVNLTAPDCNFTLPCTFTATASVLPGCTAGQVQVMVHTEATNAGTTFTATLDGIALPGSPFTYGALGMNMIEFSVAGDGGTHTFVAQDTTNPDCSATTTFTVPNCALPCNIGNLTASTGTAVTHIVQVQDFQFVPANINVTVGDIVQFVWTGAVQHTSTSDATTGDLVWNSGLHGTGFVYDVVITAPGTHGYYCIPHGAPGGIGMSGSITALPPCNEGMVAVQVGFTAVNGSASGYHILLDGVPVNVTPYAYSIGSDNTQTVNIAGDGLEHTLSVQDVTTAGCTATVNLTAPDCNFTLPCTFTATASVLPGCTTGQVQVMVHTEATNAGTTFTATLDGIALPGSPFTYGAFGMNMIEFSVAGDGGTHTFVAQDTTNPDCSATATFTVPNCVLPCNIGNLTANTGTAITHIVQVQDFQFVPANINVTVGDIVQFVWTGAVQHTSTSDATTGDLVWNSGLHGTGFVYDVVITAPGTHGYYCIPHGASGGIGMSGSITALPPCNEGMVAVQVGFTAVNGSASGYHILLDGVPVNTTPYAYSIGSDNTQTVNITGDGLEHTLSVQDVTTAGCTATVNLTAPDCNFTLPCTFTATASVLPGCTTGQVQVMVHTEATNAGTTFSATLDGVALPGSPFTYGAFGMNMIEFSVAGDGGTHTFMAQDTTNPDCSATTTFTVPNCALPCNIGNLTASTGTAVTHIVQVQDFQFVPANINVTVGDIVQFVWTGAVQHTSTSDATIGDLVWNSGLHGTGFVYDVVITAPGTHGYYCIPHGAPGGIGMSGSITALPPCNEGMVAVQVGFTAVNGSASGYHILLDGVPVNVTPYAYSIGSDNTQTVNITGDGLEHTLSVQDVTTAGCTATVNLTAPDCNFTLPCTFTATASVLPGCTAGQVQVMVHTEATNAGTTFTATLDGIALPGSPFTYGALGMNMIEFSVAGDGGTHTFVAQDTTNPDCSATTTFTVPNCALPCNIGNLTANTGTAVTHIIQVQDFQFVPANINVTVGDIVQFVWTGAVQHTSTSDATTGDLVWNSGLHGTGFVYDVVITAPGTHGYYCIPHGAPGGIGMSGSITALPPCNEGMVAVQVGFTAVNGSTSGYHILLDGVPVNVTPYAYSPGSDNTQTVNIAGDGLEHTLSVQDVTTAGCTTSVNLTAPDCNFTLPCTFTATASVLPGCTTGQVQVMVHTEATNAGTTFTATLDGIALPGSPFTYGAFGMNMIEFSVAGDGGTHTFVAQDTTNPDCSATTTFNVPNCALPCNIGNLTASTGTAITHIVQVQDFQFVPANINVTVGDIVQFVWTGAVQHTTTSDATTGDLVWNSGLHGTGFVYDVVITAPGTHGYYCIPHGAPGGIGMSGSITALPPCNEGMVAVQVGFIAVNGSASGYHILLDGVPVNATPYTYSPGSDNTQTVNISGDGLEHTLSVQDVTTAGCTTSVNLTAPDCNFTLPCTFTATASVLPGCTTGQVQVMVHTEATNAGTTFTATLDGIALPGSPFTYGAFGMNMIEFSVAGDGGTHTFVAQDTTYPDCSATTTFNVPNCALPCNIGNLTASTGTAVTHIVQVQDFQFVPANINVTVGDIVQFVWTGAVQHTTTSDATTGDLVWNSGLHGTGFVYDVVITAPGTHGYYCIPHGAPGGIGMSGSITALPPCNEGMVAVQVGFIAVNGSASGYHILLDGVPVNATPYTYSPGSDNTQTVNISGDGLEHTLSVQDVTDNGCFQSIDLLLPDCGVIPECTLLVMAEQIEGCNTENQIVVQLHIMSENGGASGFSVAVDGILVAGSPFTYNVTGQTIVDIAVVGTGSIRTIAVSDVDQPDCSTSVSISTPLCGEFCQVENLIVSSGTATTHIVEVRDYDFYPPNIDVIAGDTVRFIWTGIIAHTTTSDALSGNDVWNSGLLSQGSVYEVVISGVGEHPYYCIPHGGPGGVGMSGVINALPLCNGEQAAVSVAFSVTNGSPNGYNVFIDGIISADSPYSYTNSAGQNQVIVYAAGNENLHTITVQDLDTPVCAATAFVTTPLCGAGCSVLNLSAVSGSAITHVVEVRDFDFFPPVLDIRVGETVVFVWTGTIPHTSTSDALSGPDVWNSGLLTQGATFSVTINTEGQHRYYCIPHGGPGGIGMSGIINALPACADNEAAVMLQFEITNGSANGYNVYTDGALLSGSPFTYNNPVGQNTNIISITGDGAAHTISVQDTDNPICAATIFLTAPDCTPDCLIHNLTGMVAGVPVNHIVEVADFEFIPSQLTITQGDTITFVWTGFVPHTSTSDVASGVDMWNSGLLTQGATYQVVLNQVGEHGYYCIPHGAPGGIGMAGNITVMPPCNETNQVQASIQFTAINGSVAGFNLSVDGNPDLGNPYPYHPSGNNEVNIWIAGDGMAHTISVTDSGISGCSAEVLVTTPDCTPEVPCTAAFNYTVQGMSVYFNDLSTSADPVQTWTWDFGDGTVLTTNGTPVYTYNSSGTYNVCLTILAGDCTSTTCATIVLSNACIGFSAAFSAVELGSFGYQFADNTTGNSANSWLWGFGDGNISFEQNPFHQYAESGSYIICLLVQDTINHCLSTHCSDILVTGIEQNASIQPISAYPNPVSNKEVIIKGILPVDYEKPIQAFLYDINGKAVSRWSTTGEAVLYLPLPQTASNGWYLLELQSETLLYRVELMILRH